jgi:hypothetical protein
MTIQRETILLPVTPHAMTWLDGQLVCRENGEQYYPAYDAYPTWRGMQRGMAYGFGRQFDRAISSPGGEYTLLYHNLGTKGLLLKGANTLIREVNRSYYHADAYEYPAAFFKKGDRTFLVHCPLEYCRLDVEDAETGEIVTMRSDRQPQDFFHSRLEVSPGGCYLISKGWIWHPIDAIARYFIPDCLNNPLLLDASPLTGMEEGAENPDSEEDDQSFEFSTASFISDELLLMGLPGLNTSIGIWDMTSSRIVRRMAIQGQYGHLLAIDEYWAWDLYLHPKLINLQTGAIDWTAEDIDSGRQTSSIIRGMVLPAVAWDREHGRLAIGGENKVDVLSFRRDY